MNKPLRDARQIADHIADLTRNLELRAQLAERNNRLGDAHDYRNRAYELNLLLNKIEPIHRDRYQDIGADIALSKLREHVIDRSHWEKQCAIDAEAGRSAITSTAFIDTRLSRRDVYEGIRLTIDRALAPIRRRLER